MTTRAERLAAPRRTVVLFVNLRLRIARKLPGNVIVAGGGERVPPERVQVDGVIRESRKEENGVDKGYSSWVRSLRGLSSILDIGPDNGPSSPKRSFALVPKTLKSASLSSSFLVLAYPSGNSSIYLRFHQILSLSLCLSLKRYNG